jgi:alpha-glucosidase
MRFWLDKGVDGFRADAVYHLFEDKELRDEKRTYDPNARPGDYKSLVHNLTSNQPETYDMVMQWREILDEYARKDGNTRSEYSESCTCYL